MAQPLLGLEEQLARGALVCPKSGQLLFQKQGALTTADGVHSYRIKNGVPVFVPDPAAGGVPLADHSPADREAQPERHSRFQSSIDKIFKITGDQRSPMSENAWTNFIARLSEDDLCISVGGGPTRAHPFLVNLNIEAFDNVEVAADAHSLPYAENSTDGVQCEAVLEHLEHPGQAVREMFRILKPGGEVYCVTPFLQGFHGYPSNYFNPTREGHRLLFQRAGFEIVSDGVCVGPSWMISSLLVQYVSLLVPVRGLRALAMVAARILLFPLPFIDKIINRSKRAHVLAATTFVHARKPGCCQE